MPCKKKILSSWERMRKLKYKQFDVNGDYVYGNNIGVPVHIFYGLVWILESGSWDDNGVWIDSKTWIG